MMIYITEALKKTILETELLKIATLEIATMVIRWSGVEKKRC